MFEELIKIHKNGYNGKQAKRPFPEIVEKLVENAHTLFYPLLFFSLTSLLVGLALSYLTVMLDFYKSILGRWIIFYIIFLLVTPSVILLLFCQQLKRLMDISGKLISRVDYQKVLEKPQGGKIHRLISAFKGVNGFMLHKSDNVKELSKLKLLKKPLFYYLVVVSTALNIAYIFILCLIAFGAEVWYLVSK